MSVVVEASLCTSQHAKTRVWQRSHHPALPAEVSSAALPSNPGSKGDGRDGIHGDRWGVLTALF